LERGETEVEEARERGNVMFFGKKGGRRGEREW
jgi:hypothetical protein